jgi:hypothetical protein
MHVAGTGVAYLPERGAAVGRLEPCQVSRSGQAGRRPGHFPDHHEAGRSYDDDAAVDDLLAVQLSVELPALTGRAAAGVKGGMILGPACESRQLTGSRRQGSTSGMDTTEARGGPQWTASRSRTEPGAL